jgi:hypothetical protein
VCVCVYEDDVGLLFGSVDLSLRRVVLGDEGSSGDVMVT